jgi:transposase
MVCIPDVHVEPVFSRLRCSGRWLRLLNRENQLSQEQSVHPTELLAANQSLMTLCVLKEDLKRPWRYRHRGAARRRREDCSRRARQRGISALDPVRQAAQTPPQRPSGALPRSFAEGIKNRIKVLERMAFCHRDETCFFLRVPVALPGNLR